MARKSRTRREKSNTRSRQMRSSSRLSAPSKQASIQTAEATTVAWMMALLATLLAEVLGILTRAVSAQLGASDRLRILSNTLLLVAVVAGLVTLVLTPVALKLREVPPPQPVIVAALIIGAIPIVTVLILAWR